MNGDVLSVLEGLERERGVDREVLLQAVESALASAARKSNRKYSNLSVKVDRDSGKMLAYANKEVVEKVSDPDNQISVEEAQKHSSELKVGDRCPVEVTLAGFGRIAAQTAKQVIMQKLRQAEREIAYKEFVGHQGEIVNGAVDRFEQQDVILSIGRGEAVLPQRERPAREDYRVGERLRVYLLEVKRVESGPQIVVSRTHPELVKKMFELEVPEISQGIIQIKSVARENGERSKIAVTSTRSDVDPLGACVGVRGSRIKLIVRELRGEKIDVVVWSDKPEAYITNALSPAKVMSVAADSGARSAEVIVADDQLSLAIGKKGQNVRLAAKLTGWKINIRSDTQAKAEDTVRQALKVAVSVLAGVGPKTAEILEKAGFRLLSDVAQSSIEKLVAVPGIGEKRAGQLLKEARKLMAEKEKEIRSKLDRAAKGPGQAVEAEGKSEPVSGTGEARTTGQAPKSDGSEPYAGSRAGQGT